MAGTAPASAGRSSPTAPKPTPDAPPSAERGVELNARSALVVVGVATLLLARPEGSPLGTPFEIADRLEGFTMPRLTRLADPRFVYVRDEDHAVLIVTRGDRVAAVEEFRDVTKQGLTIRQGRAFLYRPRDHRLYELLDLDAAWDEL